MSLQSERLLNHMLRLRMTHLPNCFETLAEQASSKNLRYLEFVEQALEAESQAEPGPRRAFCSLEWKHTRNVQLKSQAHIPYNNGLNQFDFCFPALSQ